MIRGADSLFSAGYHFGPNLLSHETNPSLNGPDGAHLLYLSTTTKTAAVGGVVEVLLGRHFVESCHSSDG